MCELLLDYSADAGERLWELLKGSPAVTMEEIR
jgi:hypothetical protein